jgi:DNA-directed RNA polymerase II subunit RPB2
MSLVEYNDIKKLIKLYFDQPKILYQHLFSSFNQLVEEIIPFSLVKENNYFYENVDKNDIYLHGFRCKNVRIKPVVFETNPNEIMFPDQARKNHLNYFATVYADIEQIVEKINVLTGEKTIKVVAESHVNDPIAVANIPIMIKSKYCSTSVKKDMHGECKYDPGGYFIVNGAEKVVMSIEKMVDNKCLVFPKKDTSFPKGYFYTCQINSKSNDWSDNLQILTIKEKKDSTLTISTSQLSDIPIVIFLRALGLETDQDIISNCCYSLDDINMENLIKPSIDFPTDEEGNKIRTKEQAIEFLITKLRRNRRFSQTDEELAKVQKRIFLQKIFRQDLLPHEGENITLKIKVLGRMINKIFRVMLGRIESDDRDALQNKRIETPGVLIGQLFRQNWKKMLNEVGKTFKKKNQSDNNPVSVINLIKPNVIEQGIKTALATGIWGMNKTKKGVAQSLQRLSWFQAISLFRRIMTPSLDASTSGVTAIRHVNNLSFQFLCPVETPEGQKIGIVKSLAMTSTVSTQNDSQKEVINTIINIFDNTKNPVDVDPLEMNDWGKVYHNGSWVVVTKDIYGLYKLLKKKRQEGFIDKYTSIYLDFHNKEIGIFSDGGRLIRPILIVDNNKVNINNNVLKEINTQVNSKDTNKSWNLLLEKFPNLFEYEDIESSNFLMVAETPYDLINNQDNMNRKIEHKDSDKVNRYGDYRFVNYTHCDIHPWLMMGVVASSIPFSNHNYANRNIIFFSQAKQAIGVYLTSYKDRMDISQILYHPEIPLVTTEGMSINHSMDLPFGQNVVVAIMSYMGYNQEDSVVFNEASIERGLFRADTLKKHHSEIVKNPSTSQDDIFIKPDPNKVTGMKQGNYNKLNDKGFAPEETIITNQDTIIGKVSPIQPTGNNNKVYKDNSEQFKSNVDGVIDRVHTGIYNNDGYEMYNVRVRMERKPVIGDKFTNRHGQKGTLGIMLPQKDMPFTEEGIVPDLIMNPHSIPSRMTVAQLIECVASKIAALTGEFVDGTPFNNYDVRDLPAILKKLGYTPHGTETMYCGITGKKMEAEIFIGPTYYMRLKHMVLDKVHSRSIGPRQALTRQPLEGRSRDGGLKIGEMEKDAMVAHGIGQFLKERLMETSDITKVHVCDECGRFASKVFDKDYYYCEGCNNSTRISAVSMPYACKLLFQEITSVNILPRIRTKQSVYESNV